MKKFLSAFASVILATLTFAQAPQTMSYQAVIRDAANALVTNRIIGMRISISQGSANGTIVYTETQSPSTNSNGLVSIEIGGQPGFNSIDWTSGPYFIKTETDPAGGTNYSAIVVTSQLLSVPFALHAKTVETYNETDPLFQAHPAQGISSTLINDWNNAFSWGNHAIAGYLSTFTETDPFFNNNFDFTGASVNDLLKFDGTRWSKFTPDFASSSHLHNVANASADGFISATDWSVFNSKENPLIFTGPLNRSANIVSINAAGSTSDGYLTSSDWINFNNKGSYNLPSLAEGSLLFSDGVTVAQDNSRLFWDNINKRLGIGTMQPEFLLSLEKNTFAGLSDILTLDNLQSNNPANAVSVNFRMRDNVGQGNKLVFARIRAISTTVLDPGQTGALVFDARTNSATLSEVMRIQGANVGIGTSSPAFKLDVNGVLRASGGTSNDWNTAFSWGNHALAGYQTDIVAGTISQYWRGDKTWQVLDKEAVGLGAVENTALSTWTGSANVTAVGTITSGTWNAGSVTSSGTITGNSIVKSGGTSNQFLKADGSVDNNTYMTAIREAADEFTASAGQTGFSLTHTPSPVSKVKMYINGIRISNTAYSNSGASLTYNAANNGSYNLTAGDRIQFDYTY